MAFIYGEPAYFKWDVTEDLNKHSNLGDIDGNDRPDSFHCKQKVRN